ncbi:MAG TPA: 30S ribosomal protein S6 [Chloroflexota bacterium]
MRDYELMLVLRPDLDDDAVRAVVDRVKGLIAGRGGEVLAEDVRGRRRLAYEIRHFREGIDVLFRLRLSPQSADELERSLRLTEQVIRHLLVRLEG